MTLRAAQLVSKASVTTSGSVQVAQAVSKAVTTSIGSLQVSQMVVKAIVRPYKITQIVKYVPPVPFTVICSCNPVCCFRYGA